MRAHACPPAILWRTDEPRQDGRRHATAGPPLHRVLEENKSTSTCRSANPSPAFGRLALQNRVEGIVGQSRLLLLTSLDGAAKSVLSLSQKVSGSTLFCIRCTGGLVRHGDPCMRTLQSPKHCTYRKSPDHRHRTLLQKHIHTRADERVFTAQKEASSRTTFQARFDSVSAREKYVESLPAAGF